MLNRLSTSLIVTSAVACALLAAIVWTSSDVYAAGAVGNGGTPGGGGFDSVETRFGYGWRQFTVDSPVHPRNAAFGPPWSTTNARCKALGAKSIIAFVIYRSAGGVENSVNLNYERWNGRTGYAENWAGYHGRDGFPWMTVSEAKRRYDSVDANKTGYTWGQNVGWFCFDFAPAPPPAVRWTVKGSTSVNRTTAKPGDILNWGHRIFNDGPDNMNERVRYGIDRIGFSDRDYDNDTGSEIKIWQGRNKQSLTIPTNERYKTSYKVQSDDVGRRLCQRIFWIKRAWNDTNYGRSSDACVVVPYGYNLVPSVSVSPDMAVIDETLDKVTITPRVRNDGPTKSHESRATVVRMHVAKNTNMETGYRDSPSDACGYFGWRHGAGIRGCDVLNNTGKTTKVYNVGSNQIPPTADFEDDISGLDLAVGEQICYVTSVTRYDETSGSASRWRHSDPVCMTVVKKPKVQIHGGDLMVGRAQVGGTTNPDAEVKTSITAKKIELSDDLRAFGSWVEYGVFAPRGADVASGASIAGEIGGDGALSTNQGLRSPLTFENISQFGYFGDNLGTRPDVRAQFTGGSSSACGGVITMESMSAGDQIRNCSGVDVRVKGNLKLGQSVIIKADKINIVDNITYDGAPINNLSDIPQLVLIADNIVIDSKVERVDAWLVGDSQEGGTNGWVVTCTDTKDGEDKWQSDAYVTGNGGLTSEVCDRTLTVNGPVMANSLFLRRTAGSGTGTGSNDPAEIINLRSDAYLWASQYGTSDSKITTTYTRDLAPRF